MKSLFRLQARVPLWVLTVATAVGLVGSTLVGVTTYAQQQQQAVALEQQAISYLQDQVGKLMPERDALTQAVANAQAVLDGSSGKTLDETARTALTEALAIANKGLTQTNDALAKADAALKKSASKTSGQFVLPWTLTAEAQSLANVGLPVPADITNLVSSLGSYVEAVQAAQEGWKAEQDRIAAAAARAAAARAAAARAAAAAKTLSQTGGQTTPTAPAPPPAQVAAAPLTPGFSIEGYITNLAPNAYVVWVADMCETKYPNQNVYLCGYATVNLNGSNTDRVPITLDSTLAQRYVPTQYPNQRQVGLSVLVHEAAHARQWLKYGQSIQSAWTTSTGLTGFSAIEYMADCATIVKLGYSTGTYTNSCQPADLAEAATYWQ